MDCLSLGSQPEGEGLAGKESQVKRPEGNSWENGSRGKERRKGTRRKGLMCGKRKMGEPGREKIMEREKGRK